MTTSEQFELVTLDDISSARHVIESHPFVVKTPLIHDAEKMWDVVTSRDIRLFLKLENMQTTGSFKMRGVVNQLHHAAAVADDPDQSVVTMSAGNYGKAFAFALKDRKCSAVVVMPEHAAQDRERIISGLGAKVMRVPDAQLQPEVDSLVAHQGMLFMHSFDDKHLIAGYASIGMEIIESVIPDVVLVPCGGGGLVSGIASAIRLSGHRDCRIYAVEPEGSCTMFNSMASGRAEHMAVNSIAKGLSPPYCGTLTLKHCQEHINGVLLVSDLEITSAMLKLHERGLLVETSGAAAFAALLTGKVKVEAGQKVVIVISGGNISPEETLQWSEKFKDRLYKM